MSGMEGGERIGVSCVAWEGGFQHWLYKYWKVRFSKSSFGWSKFESSALSLKRIFWDLNGVGVVKEG